MSLCTSTRTSPNSSSRPSTRSTLRQAQGRQHPGLRLPFDKLRAGLEKVYQNALVIELRKLGLEVIPEACIKVYYNGQVVGEYFADLLVAGAVIVEIKAVRMLAPEHEAQLLNYPSTRLRVGLKATPYEVGLLLNPSTALRRSSGQGSGRRFGPKPEIKRKIYDNPRKGAMAWVKE